jgi:hypothetical protein
MLEKPYVLLIHGTWTNAPGWHSSKAPNNFCSALNEALKLSGLGDAVWRSGNEGSVEFNWSGSNKHEDRIRAGDLLSDRLRSIDKHDRAARIHIVAHSHGCNVTLRAIENYLRTIEREFWSILRYLFRSQEELSVEDAVDRVFGGEAREVKERCQDFFERLKETVDGYRQSFPQQSKDRRIAVAHFIRREGRVLARQWLDSPRNRLGRVVFLGPPFLRKIWAPRRRLVDALIRAIDFSCAFAFALTAFYISCLFGWTSIWLLSALPLWLFKVDLLRITAPNPLDWSSWFLVPASLLGSGAGIAAAMVAASTSRQTDRNLYFDGDSLSYGGFDGAKPIETLVVTAEFLDEVLLGFSAEPIVYGALLPRIREFFDPKISWRLPPTSLGHERGISEEIWRFIIFGFRIMSAFGWFILRPITVLWERIWTRRLMQLLSASAYGVQLHELERALIVASSRLDEPRFFNEKVWDVTELLISSDTVHDDGVAKGAKYSFLWEDSLFNTRKGSSWIWRSIEPHRIEIEKHYGRFSQSATIGAEDQLARACIMLEERFSEAIGAVGLMHTAYHSNRIVIENVSRFIVSGESPT